MENTSVAPNSLTQFLELGRAFHNTFELEGLLESILQQTQATLQSAGASIWLINEQKTELQCMRTLGPGSEHVLGRTVSADMFFKVQSNSIGQTVRIDDVTQLGWWTEEANYIRPEARAALIAPLLARGEPLGLVNVFNKITPTLFTDEDVQTLTALAGHAAIAIHNAQFYERQEKRQKLLDQISRHLQQILDIEALIPRILDEVNKAINAEGQSLWLTNADQTTITCRFATGSGSDSIKGVTVPLAHSIVGSTVLTQQPLLIEDAQKDPRFYRGADDKTGFLTRSLMSVPMVREGKAVGAIQAVNKRTGGLFTRDDLDLFRSIADSAALAIENARLYADLSASYDSTLDALAAALDLRDRETEGHSRRVVEYTARLAQQINLPSEVIVEIRRGALIHDIGKIGVPDAVLHKPGPLSPDERKIIERHPMAGYEMLADIPYLHEEIKIVLSHQEKWDGTGYPFGLKGEAIPLGARLFAIADTFDALTSDRPYRKSRPYEVARQIMIEESGKQFDPMAVEAFLAVPKEEWEQIRAMVIEEVRRRREQHAERIQRRRGTTGMLPPLPPPPPAAHA
jgi:HD-GYP domain-containing protein (c-di-GMP phosphodiesterase class II)